MKVIPLEEFSEYVQSMRVDRDSKFEAEYNVSAFQNLSPLGKGTIVLCRDVSNLKLIRA